jgi:thiol:disulfide interchange protein DsbA
MMKRWIGWTLLALVVAMPASVLAQRASEVIYLPHPQPTDTPHRIEVIEFFWYGCPHCDSLEPALEAWEKQLPPDVALRRVPVIWRERDATALHARLFYTLQVMDLLPKQHQAVFDALHRAKQRIRNDREVIEWAAAQGIDGAKFDTAYQSSAVRTHWMRARNTTRDYNILSVPSFAVNGKVLVKVNDADGVFKTLDQLIAAERARKP